MGARQRVRKPRLGTQAVAARDGALPRGATAPEGQDVPAELDEGLCAADPCETGFAPADIRVVANNEFLDANPAARALFESVEIPVSDIAAQNLEYDSGANTQPDIEEQAARWIEENRDQVDEWLGGPAPPCERIPYSPMGRGGRSPSRPIAVRDIASAARGRVTGVGNG